MFQDAVGLEALPNWFFVGNEGIRFQTYLCVYIYVYIYIYIYIHIVIYIYICVSVKGNLREARYLMPSFPTKNQRVSPGVTPALNTLRVYLGVHGTYSPIVTVLITVLVTILKGLISGL